MSLLTAITNLNWWAVLVVFVLHVAISLLWYQPFLFGKAWVKLTGKEMSPAKKWMPAGLLAHFLCVFGFAVILKLANAATLLEGILLALLVSICFIGAILAGELVWEKIPFKLFLIRLGDQVLTLVIAAVILVLWK